MRVAITGSSGLVGTALRRSLDNENHEVIRLVRREPAEPGEVRWDPQRGDLQPAALEGIDAVINLAGANIGDHRWTASYKKVLLRSRVDATRTIVEALRQLGRPPKVFVSMSGVSVYGEGHTYETLDEQDPTGDGFQAHVGREWESAAGEATASGITVCIARSGMIMSAEGGALARMLPFFRLGLGGPLGGGEQYWSYVSLADTVRALRFLIETPDCAGVYNITAPEPVTNAEFSRVLARALNRPMLLPVPAFALRLRLGELAEAPLASLRVVPNRLLKAGFEFDHPNARAVVAAALRPPTGAEG